LTDRESRVTSTKVVSTPVINKLLLLESEGIRTPNPARLRVGAHPTSLRLVGVGRKGGAHDDREPRFLLVRYEALHNPVSAESHAVKEAEGADGLAAIAPRDVLLLDEEET
jgi:hypothetical protein